MDFNNQHRRFKEVRKVLNFNQKEFADLLGIDQAQISQLEHGKIGIGNRIMVILIEKFNVSSDWLYTGKGLMFRQFIGNDLMSNQEIKNILAKALVDIDTIIQNLKEKNNL